VRWKPINTASRGSGPDGPDMTTAPGYVRPPRLLLYTAEGIATGYYDWYYHPGYGGGGDLGESPWRQVFSGEQLYEVTHWMELPQEPIN